VKEGGWSVSSCYVGLGGMEVSKEESLEGVGDCESVAGFLYQPPLGGIESFVHILEKD